jgi:hypothetical protein
MMEIKMKQTPTTPKPTPRTQKINLREVEARLKRMGKDGEERLQALYEACPSLLANKTEK